MIKHCLTPIVSALLLAALVAGCAVNPVTGRNELSLFDETQEINLGTNQYGPTQQSQGGPYTADPELSEYVSKVGQRLARVSDRSLPYEFIIIDDSTPNAWALPGGKIGINRGLLVRLNSEAELAAVLSHEIVHAAARHSAKSIERGLLMGSVLNAAGAALESSNVNYAGIVQDGARLGSQMLLQSYGREAELESDAYGMIYMLRAGYDPEAAVSLQETFVALSSGPKIMQQTSLAGRRRLPGHNPHEAYRSCRRHPILIPPPGRRTARAFVSRGEHRLEQYLRNSRCLIRVRLPRRLTHCP